MLRQEIKDFLRHEATTRFLRYVQINTTTDPNSGTHPSSAGQWLLGRLLKEELEAVNAQNVELDAYCYVYATLPATPGAKGPAITFCAHMDTSNQESGDGVRPVVHENYAGGVITFADDPELTLSPDDSPELLEFIGENIITASGQTLLGADDKAGVAEIMAAAAAFDRFKDLPHPEIRICFTPDEEIGEGPDHVDLTKWGKYGYTLDGGILGSFETENFNAQKVALTFRGCPVHPGMGKNRLVNAIGIATRFFAAMSEHDTPEHTEEREGYHFLYKLEGNEKKAIAEVLLRDFDKEGNARRVLLFHNLINFFETRHPGLKIDLQVTTQYENMKEILHQYPEVVRMGEKAIEQVSDLVVRKELVRGGTDGARITFLGVPTPNIFAGGLMFHSRKEWIPQIALQKAAEVIIHLSHLWVEDNKTV